MPGRLRRCTNVETRRPRQRSLPLLLELRLRSALGQALRHLVFLLGLYALPLVVDLVLFCLDHRHASSSGLLVDTLVEVLNTHLSWLLLL